MAPRRRSLRAWIALPVCVGRGSGMVTVDPFTRRALRRRQSETAVTLAQPPQDRHGKQHHPGLANDLSGEKLKATKSKVEEHDTVDNQPDKTADRKNVVKGKNVSVR